MEKSSEHIRPLHFYILMLITDTHLPEIILDNNERIIYNVR